MEIINKNDIRCKVNFDDFNLSFKPKKINFLADKFEQLVLDDLIQNNEDMKNKLHRNLTDYFSEYIQNQIQLKKQLKLLIKGGTRSGKSLVGLKILHKINFYYPDKNFEPNKFVCANQKILRQKLMDCDFADYFLIDENAFNKTGQGSMSEALQLKDLNNIIAKNNNHMIYITPEVFLNVGATIGLSFISRDDKNWLSKFLLYHIKNGIPSLLGYVIFDIGSLFRDCGCYIYRETGGCTNPNKKKFSEISEEAIKYSSCIPEVINKNDLKKEKKSCPFYDVCTSKLCEYEKIKDTWIEKELKGGIDERTYERINASIELLIKLGVRREDNSIMLKAKNGKAIKIKARLYLPKITNAKFTESELDEIITILLTLTDLDFLKEACDNIEKNFDEILNSIPYEE